LQPRWHHRSCAQALVVSLDDGPTSAPRHGA
jgi:hypothetical protein